MYSITISSSSSYSLVTGVLLVVIVLIFLKNKRSSSLPPGPPAWPIVGNLPQVGGNPHQSLVRLAHKYGPLMTIKLGIQTAIVVSSPSVAREVRKNNDQRFSSRPMNTVIRVFSYRGTSLLWSPYGPHWRLLRRISNTEIFSTRRQHLRRDEVFTTIDEIMEDCKQGYGVKIGERAFMISLSIMGKMICGKKLFERGSARAAEFRGMVKKALELAGFPDLSGFFPFLERFDLQGLNAKAKSLAQGFDNMFDIIIEERLAQTADIPLDGNEAKGFLDVMLNLREDGTQLTLENIKAVMMFSTGPSTFTTDAEQRHHTSFTQLMMSDTPPHLRQSIDSGVAAAVASSQPLTEGLVMPNRPRAFEVDLHSGYLLALDLEKSLNKRSSEHVRKASSSPLSPSTQR